jgi:riboflavin kinase / FMN adenylyltransferase
MKVYYELEDFTALPHAVVASGTFDGVHLGHQKILESLVLGAKKVGGESVLITFFPHPRTVLFNHGKNLKQLTTLPEKIALIESFGVDHLLIIPFTREFSEIESKTFIEEILVKRIGVKLLIMGYDHRFGKNREGSFEYLKVHSGALGFDVQEISRVDLEEITSSSSAIREALQEGNVEIAKRLLGRPFSIAGKVVKGRQLGRTLGYATANIDIAEPYKIIPADGVYAAKVTYNKKQYNGVLNIGVRPTVNGLGRTIEVHIFDFDKDIYGEQLQIDFIAKIRSEQKFESLEALKNQISADSATAKALLA